MSLDAYIVIGIVVAGVILFATDRIPVDFTALLIMAGFMVTGILSPQEGLAGFSNPATITVVFMFVISHALLKTGSLQRIGPVLGDLFKRNFNLGLLITILFVGVASAFVNNTPIVAMFIPVMISVAHQSKFSPSKLLIPLSYASIFGGTCTLIGTSTNMLVSGIAEQNGLDGFSIFISAPIGIVVLIVGTIYLFIVGKKLLPDRASSHERQTSFRDYITEIQILQDSELIGASIMESVFYRDVEVDIIEVLRNGSAFTLPPGDFRFQKGDVVKIRCNVEKIKELKGRLRVEFTETKLKIGDSVAQSGNTTIMELIISNGSEFESRTLREMDFRRRYRAVPLAIIHREEVAHEKLHDIRLMAGDIILTEVKTHRVQEFKREEMRRNSPFVILSEEGIIDFNRPKFLMVAAVLGLAVIAAATGLVSIVASVIVAVLALLVTRTIRMKEMYGSIEWRIMFLLAGALSIGTAMAKTGLADLMATELIGFLGDYGPVAILAGLYLATTLLTEIMSNNATAALFAPIAISTAEQMDISPTPLLMGVMVAASASFMTPIGYHTNTMVYTSGQYKFLDFFKVGAGLMILIWLVSVLLIPILYPF
ncbi:MAG: SLC13 family permease [Cyclobacteriaceae bacterium]